MAFLNLENVSIKGVSAAVPSNIEYSKDYHLFSETEARKFSDSTGIYQRRIASTDTTASDLCYSAADKLLLDLNWNREDVDCLIFVTQTPDYILPSTSCILQSRLGLSKEIVALDISLGCSGWIYGLMTIGSLLNTGSFKKGLLLVGDTITKTCSKDDKSTYPLFGDAGTATALEFDERSEGLKFHLSADGSGADSIIIPDGGYRSITSEKSLENQKFEKGISRTPLNLVLDGMNVFSFGITKAPKSVNNLLESFDINSDNIDYFLFHQANLFMNEKIRKKLKIPKEKVPYILSDYGNTSCATIPLTLVEKIGSEVKNRKLDVIACGFGVGLSWGSAWFNLENIVCPEIIEI